MTTVLLVDDHPVVRDGYKRLFERQPGYSVIAEADDASSAYEAYRRHSPDVVVMDMSLPGPGGLEAVRHIRQWDGAARIMMLTMHGSAAFALKAFEAGALGYATKSSSASEIVQLLARLKRGEKVISLDVAQELAADRINRSAAALDDLGARETEILRLVATGVPAPDIATALNLSEKTVRNYHYQIKSKLSVPNDASLVWLALRAGLVSLDKPL